MPAITKLREIHKTLDKAISYIIDPDKTNNYELVSGRRCNPFSAAIEMEAVADYGEAMLGSKDKYVNGDKVLAYHFVQSFDLETSNERSLEELHEMGEELAEKFTGGLYQYVVATHVDTDHVHNHIIFNARSDATFYKFRCPPGSGYFSLRDYNDQVLAAHGLHQNMPERGDGTDYFRRRSYTELLKEALDKAIVEADDFNDFLDRIGKLGIVADFSGKHPTFIFAGRMKRTRRGKKISIIYASREKIEEAIDKVNSTCLLTLEEKIAYRTIGENLARTRMLEQTLAFMNRNNCSSLADFDSMITSLEAEANTTEQHLNEARIKFAALNRQAAYESFLNQEKNKNAELPSIQTNETAEKMMEISELTAKLKDTRRKIRETQQYRQIVDEVLNRSVGFTSDEYSGKTNEKSAEQQKTVAR